VEDRNGGVSERAILVTVRPVNDLPSISKIDDLRIPASATAGSVEFKVEDLETPPAVLKFTARSSNPSLLPVPGLIVSGAGSTKTLRLTPTPGQAGDSVVVLTVTDADGGEASTEFKVTVVPDKPEIVTPPASLVLATGKDAEFTVVARGIGLV